MIPIKLNMTKPNDLIVEYTSSSSINVRIISVKIFRVQPPITNYGYLLQSLYLIYNPMMTSINPQLVTQGVIGEFAHLNNHAIYFKLSKEETINHIIMELL